MIELGVTVRFLSPSLGSAKRPGDGVFLLTRSPDGRIVFPATWHYANLSRAARLINRYQHAVGQLAWDPFVCYEGQTPLYRRYTGPTRYAQHESLPIGARVTFAVTAPNDVGADGLSLLMEKAGKFYGLSPFGVNCGFGRFEVIECRPVAQRWVTSPESEGAQVSAKDPGPRCEASDTSPR